ncbi:pyridoxal phosphate-dependent aminotransferase [Candidatus Micrarchaeota archaeon]|nr:pyridoxal phosphate-dependent aminotransferase [Candidatus Micrarchaeota archaeon]
MSFYELAEKVIELERSGRKIIKMHIGDTNLPTPEIVTKTAIDYLQSEKPRYGSAAGLLALREKIARREGCEIENVVVGPGSKHLIYGIMSILLKRGDKVITPDPSWPAYELICNQLGLKMQKIKTSREDNWCPKETDFDAKLVIICNPNNPTSTVYPESWVRKVIENAKKRGNFVILDEAYRALAFETIKNYDGAIRIRSFSKEFNMEGWRLGYAIMPKKIAEKMIKYNQITITCVADFVQHAGLAVLENEEEITTKNRKIWKERADIITRVLNESGFEFTKPDSGIYIFATKPEIKNADKYCMERLAADLAIAPGTDFGESKYVRLCINQDEKTLNTLNKLL